jgi:hypothetical protein
MDPGLYVPTRPQRFIDFYLPAGDNVEYQDINQQSDGSLIFDNVFHILNVSLCGGRLAVTDDMFMSAGKTAI